MAWQISRVACKTRVRDETDNGWLSWSSATCDLDGLTEIAGLDNGGPDIDGRIPLPSKVKQ